MIRNITSEDTGLYTLKVNNSAGQANDSNALSLKNGNMFRPSFSS